MKVARARFSGPLLAMAMVPVALAGCEVVIGGDGTANAAVAATVPTGEWSRFVEHYIAATLAANPVFAVVQGKHEYDGRLPDWSAAGLEAEKERLTKAMADAQAFDATKLTPEQRFERDYLVAEARGALFWLATADLPHTNPSYYSALLDPAVYVTVPYASAETRLKSYTTYLKAVPAAIQQVRANLKTPLPLSFVDYSKNAFGGYAEFYMGDGLKAFAGVGTRSEQAALEAAAGQAAAAMTSLVQWTESQRATAGANFALGPQRFQQMLYDTEMVDTPIAELKRIGEADLAANQAALKAACARYAAGATVQACMDKMNTNKPEGGAVSAARAQLTGLKQFIIDKDLVSIPGTEEAKVEEAPSYNRQNFAYINIPGPYEKNLPSTYYIAPADRTWPKAMQDAFVPGKADLLFTSAHEVWPGHFLNFLHANRSKFLFGRLFVGYAYAEGWAHYTEEMMRVAGVGGGTDEVMIGQLSNALLRDCRYLSAIGMHAGGMTQAESFTLFRDQCYQDEGNARQQAARGTYDPAYLNYTMGKLMIRKLRDDWTAGRGGAKAWKAYHDTFLSYGGPPIPLVRAQMMGGAAKAVF